MSSTLVKSFDSFADAQMARDALLAGGFSSSSVQLALPDDEAGPVAGNFTVGDASGKERYEEDFRHVAHRGHYRLTVDADDEEQAMRASEITGRFGAIDVEARAARYRPSL